MKLGFQFSETMAGTYTEIGEPEHTGAISFRGTAAAESLLAHARDGMTTLSGTLDMAGVADDVPISGTIEIRPLTKRIIRYEFGFVGNDGAPYRFAGQKDIRFDQLKETMTHLEGVISDASGRERYRAQLAFDLRQELVPFLVSWRRR